MHMIGGAVWLILLAWLTYYSVHFFVKNISPRKSSLRFLFAGFRQKMWMTVGLGIIFFGLYALLVWLASSFFNFTNKQQIFLLMYRHPVKFIYLGLLIFVTISVSIYLARILIKHLYNSKQ